MEFKRNNRWTCNEYLKPTTTVLTKEVFTIEQWRWWIVMLCYELLANEEGLREEYIHYNSLKGCLDLLRTLSTSQNQPISVFVFDFGEIDFVWSIIFNSRFNFDEEDWDRVNFCGSKRTIFFLRANDKDQSSRQKSICRKHVLFIRFNLCFRTGWGMHFCKHAGKYLWE